MVGFSGSGKTPGLNVTLRALAAIERDRKGKLSEVRRAHELRLETAQSRSITKKWKAEIAAAVEEGRTPPAMPPEALKPGEFVLPRLSVTNATIERIPAFVASASEWLGCHLR